MKRLPGVLLALLVLLPRGGASAAPAATTAASGSAAQTRPADEDDRDQAWDDEEGPGLGVRGRGGQVGVFQDVVVPRGQVRRGDVVCIFGNATVDGDVTHDVVVVGGSLHLSGGVGHDVVTVLSTVTIEDGVEVGHDLVNVLGSMDNRGTVRHDTMNFPLFFRPLRFRTPFGMIGTVIAWLALLLTVLVFLVLLLIATLAPDRVRVLSEEVPVSYLLAFLVGLGGYVGVLVAHVLLWITIIGIPLSGLLYLAFLVMKWLGVAGICHYVGRSLGRLFGWQLSPHAAILVGFLPFALLYLLPMFLGGIGFLFALGVRFLFWVVVEIPAVGLLILTRAGSRPRKNATWPTPPGLVVTPPPPPPAPPPPAP